MTIDTADQRLLKRAVFVQLKSELSEYGFNLKVAKGTFRRQHDDVTDIFQLVFLDNKIDDQPGWRVDPAVGVRIEKVEEIFHQTSGFDLKYQSDTITIGSFVGELTSGPSGACEFRLDSIDDVPLVCKSLMNVFTNFALPYFTRYDNLASIDGELNADPLTSNANRGGPCFRCTTGVIVARLVGRADYEHLVEVYTDRMRTSDKGFYLKRFLALVKSLSEMNGCSW